MAIAPDGGVNSSRDLTELLKMEQASREIPVIFLEMRDEDQDRNRCFQRLYLAGVEPLDSDVRIWQLCLHGAKKQ